MTRVEEYGHLSNALEHVTEEGSIIESGLTTSKGPSRKNSHMN
jgi:hypothetical protein